MEKQVDIDIKMSIELVAARKLIWIGRVPIKEDWRIGSRNSDQPSEEIFLVWDIPRYSWETLRSKEQRLY